MTSNIYRDLNISEGASINEIKAAFRKVAKDCHPDAVGADKANVEKFIKAQSAYQKLMKKAVAHNKARRAAQSSRTETSENNLAANWRFTSRRETGLDVYYSLSVLRPAAGGAKVVLPWQAKEACPRCLGQGRSRVRSTKPGLRAMIDPAGRKQGMGPLFKEHSSAHKAYLLKDRTFFSRWYGQVTTVLAYSPFCFIALGLLMNLMKRNRN